MTLNQIGILLIQISLFVLGCYGFKKLMESNKKYIAMFKQNIMEVEGKWKKKEYK